MVPMEKHSHEGQNRCRDGEAFGFVVQLEVDDKGWKPVVRYNYAHGKPHRDLIHRKGKKEKLWLDMNLKEVLNYGKKDITKNWKKYIKECGYDVEID